MRRVVVTGMGLVTPLGVGLEQNWCSLTRGESGIRAIESFEVSDLPSKIAGQVPRGDTASGLFNADDWCRPRISAGWMDSSSLRWLQRPRR